MVTFPPLTPFASDTDLPTEFASASPNDLRSRRYETLWIIPPETEMQKVADAADISVLIFGPFWVIFGPFWQFWVIFGPLWAILGNFWADLGNFGSFFGYFG